MTNCWLGAKRPLRPRRLDAESGGGVTAKVIPAADFTPHRDLRDLGVYLWNEKVLNNYFCKTCGIFTYIGDGENAKDGYRVNPGCVEGVNPLALEISIIDGKASPVMETIVRGSPMSIRRNSAADLLLDTCSHQERSNDPHHHRL